MGKVQKKLFLWAGIFGLITSVLSFILFLLLNFVLKEQYAEIIVYLQNDLGSSSIFGDFKTYLNSCMVCAFLVNLYLGFKYISYSKMSIRKLASKSGGMLFVLLINVFCGGNLIALILAIIAMSKPITPNFDDKNIKEIDRNVLDNNPNAVAQILKVKQDKLNGILTDEEYKIQLNKILEEEAKKYLWKTREVLFLKCQVCWL